jgi:universal stress protein family protein
MTGLGEPGHEPRIVVGIDGSESSQAALRWALRQAKLGGGRVEAVIAWRYPVDQFGQRPAFRFPPVQPSPVQPRPVFPDQRHGTSIYGARRRANRASLTCGLWPASGNARANPTYREGQPPAGVLLRVTAGRR